MAKVWEILLQDHPGQLAALIQFQWNTYGTKLDILCNVDERLVTAIFTRYPTLTEIDKTIREKPKQKRGKGW